jgi:hypothetical protein
LLKADNGKFIGYIKDYDFESARKISKDNLKIDENFSRAVIMALHGLSTESEYEIYTESENRKKNFNVDTYKSFLHLFHNYGIDFIDNESDSMNGCSILDFLIVGAGITDLPINKNSFFCVKPATDRNLTMIATQLSLYDVVRESLEFGVDVNSIDRYQETAIFFLPINISSPDASFGRLEDAEKMLNLLVSYGADLQHLNFRGCSFIDGMTEEQQNFFKEKFNAINGDTKRCPLLKNKKKTGQ